MGNFQMATKIFEGKGAIDELKTIPMHRVLVICDPFMEKSHKVEVVTDRLAENDEKYLVFAEVVPDPTIDVVAKGIIEALRIKPDTLIALGGGSAMDTAKAVRHIYSAISGAENIGMICIPTTSGTGSEVTSFVVITDPKAQTKYALVDPSLIPDYAILDPTFTVSVPAGVTADTGMDVLTHTLEAYVSTAASDFTDACAEKAMKIVWENLENVVKDGQNEVLRGKVHNASCLAGIAFNEASLGICHSLAHALGGKFHIPHGKANALLLPHVILYNAGLDLSEDLPALEKYEKAARMLGIQAGTKRATVHGLVANIHRKMQRMNIPKYITDCGVNEEEYLAAVPEMAQKALADRCTATNPRPADEKALEELYKSLCKGGS